MLIGGELISASVNLPGSVYDSGFFAKRAAEFSVGPLSTALTLYDEDYAELYSAWEMEVPSPNLLLPRPASVDLPVAVAALALMTLYFVLRPVARHASAQLVLGIYEAKPRSLQTGPRRYLHMAGALLLRAVLTDWLVWTAAAFRLTMHFSSLAGNAPAPGILYLLYALLSAAAAVYLVVQSYRYQPVPLLAAMHPELSIRELTEESRRIMSGRAWRLFCLDMSFLGWHLIAFLPAAALIVLCAVFPSLTEMLNGLLTSPLSAVALTAALSLPAVPVWLYRQTARAVFICDAARS